MSLESFYLWVEPGANGTCTSSVSAAQRTRAAPQLQYSEKSNRAPFVEQLLQQAQRAPRPQLQQLQQPPSDTTDAPHQVGIGPPRHPYQPRSRLTLPHQPLRDRSVGPASSRSAHPLSRQSAAGLNLLLRAAPRAVPPGEVPEAREVPATLLRSGSGTQAVEHTDMPAVQFHAGRTPLPEPEPRVVRFHHVPKSASTLRSQSATRRPAGRTLRAQRSDDSSLGATAGASRFSAVVEPRMHVLPRAGASVSLLHTGR